MSIIYSGTSLAERAKSLLVQPPLASLVVRTYNEAKHLGNLLESVAVQQVASGRPVDVIVVDSGSQDGTDAIALKHGAHLLRINKEEFSYGRALNVGCAAAEGEFLVLISGHCLPDNENWLEELLKAFSDPAVAMTYGRQVGDDSTKFSEARVYEKYYPENKASQGPAFCNNANAAVRRSIWRRFRYDEDLTGLEDIELGRRVGAAGFRIEYAPRAVVRHIHVETWPQVRRRYEREAIALRHIHPEMHLTAWEAGTCFTSAVWKDFQALLRTTKRITTLGEIIHYRFNQFVGSWLGNRPHRELSKREKERYFFPT
jgi:rhamnosyltransferase